jgi:hypothetical protein
MVLERTSVGPATAMPAGCWSRRPGTTANPIGPAGNSAPDRTDSPRWSETAPTAATVGCISAGAGWTLAEALHHQRRGGRPRACRMGWSLAVLDA